MQARDEITDSFKAFISYSHNDDRWAKWLHRSLESYRTPKRLRGANGTMGPVPERLTPIFRDRDELATSQDLSETIEDALARSENLIVVCSVSAARSRWVEAEIRAFQQLGRGERIYCFVVDGDPGAMNSDADCIPSILRERPDNGLDSGFKAEPLAADARPNADGRGLALQKIIATLLGVRLDDLRQREHQRRYRRLLAITAASLLLSTVTAALAAYAYFAQVEADQRRVQAETLLSFMVQDLRSSLEPIGRLDLMQSISRQAMDYFSNVNESALSDDELVRQSQVLTQLGQIQVAQLQYDQALDSFREAYQRSQTLSSNHPKDGDRLFNLGQSEFWVGYVHWVSGSLTEAKVWLERYRDTSELLTQIDSARQDWAREVGFAHHNLAVLATEEGDLHEARRGFEQVLETLTQIMGRDGGDVQLLIDVADSVSWLGNLELSEGRLGDSLDRYRYSTSILESAVEREPDNAITQRFLATALGREAFVLSITGDYSLAVETANKSIEHFSSLIALDPSNAETQLLSVAPKIARATALVGSEQWELARVSLTDLLTDITEVENQNLPDHQLVTYHAKALLLRASLSERDGNSSSALQDCLSAIAMLENIIKADRLDERATNALLSGFLEAAQIEAAQGNGADAERYLNDARSLLNNHAMGENNPFILDPKVRMLLMQGKSEDAESVVTALSQMGYQPVPAWPARLP